MGNLVCGRVHRVGDVSPMNRISFVRWAERAADIKFSARSRFFLVH